MKNEDVERCAICLEESADLIKACQCSSRAHKKCLVDYITHIDFASSAPDAMIDPISVSDDPGMFHSVKKFDYFLSWKPGIDFLRVKSMKATGRVLMNDKVVCPQCRVPLFIEIHPRTKPLQRLGQISDWCTDIGFKYETLSIDYPLVTLPTVGYSMLKALCPVGLEPDVSQKLTLGEFIAWIAHLLLHVGLPLSLLSLRENRDRLQGAVGMFLLMFKFKGFSIEQKLLGFIASASISVGYDKLYNHFINRRYLRWFYSIKPFSLLRTAFEELDCVLNDVCIHHGDRDQLRTVYGQLLKEETELQDLKNERLHKNKLLPWYKRFWNWLIPNYTERERKIFEIQRQKEDKLLEEYDFGFRLDDLYRFHEADIQNQPGYFESISESRGLISFTSLIWPFGGALIGYALGNIPIIDTLFSPITTNKDECTLIRNLIGMSLCVFIKDGFNLFKAWRQTYALNSLEFVQVQFEERSKGSVPSNHEHFDELMDMYEHYHLHRNHNNNNNNNNTSNNNNNNNNNTNRSSSTSETTRSTARALEEIFSDEGFNLTVHTDDVPARFAQYLAMQQYRNLHDELADEMMSMAM